ncbi:ATP-binding protein [Streptomyces cadmiisoli]|uniref:ATP-binding protein n=1 Tax=Streptomyces cadmiisoli TaxID=2184053 RepID=UPI001FE4102C|nr:SbcC/MukB-like Walker B domain-containing protein [Streptomyces cadmiisoli]
MLALRRELATATGVSDEVLPFAGELIQVRDDEAEWAGAAERVLHGFALSLLVPHAHYDTVSAWVNGRHLGLRLVYYQVPAHTPLTTLPDDPTLLTAKLQLKSDSWARDWLAARLRSRADYLCAETWTRSPAPPGPAVTRQGLIKGGGGRHEKNDTHRIDDRRNWVLGWSNQAKLDALLAEATRLTRESADITTATRELEKQQRARAGTSAALTLLASVDAYAELDWPSTVADIEQFEQQKSALEAEAGLDKLTAQLRRTEDEIVQISKTFTTGQEELGGLRRDVQHIADLLDRTTTFLATCDLDGMAEHEDALRKFLPAADGDGLLEMLDDAERQCRRTAAAQQQQPPRRPAPRQQPGSGADDRLPRQIPGPHRRAGQHHRIRRRLPHVAQPAHRRGPAPVRGTVPPVPAHQRHPRHRFLPGPSRCSGTADPRAHRRDQHLVGRHRLQPGALHPAQRRPTPNREVREFQHDLRACTSEALSNDAGDAYTEEKFLQVKALLDRFKGRPEHTRLDKEWTARVTDVRRWFVFSASELNREDDAEYEVHSDSGGKSGGQKEKLAYTILAASLAYQFRIDPTAAKPKTFHFVTIDEAFGRGDDPSAHFALDLFQRLGLQLLVVTPLQKLHVIEPHVTRVGYVDRPDKTRSRLNNLTIEEFRARKQAAAQQANQPPKEQS